MVLNTVLIPAFCSSDRTRSAIGEPQGQDLLVEWVKGKLYPVYPPKVALHAPTEPKPPWGG